MKIGPWYKQQKKFGVKDYPKLVAMVNLPQIDNWNRVNGKWPLVRTVLESGFKLRCLPSPSRFLTANNTSPHTRGVNLV